MAFSYAKESKVTLIVKPVMSSMKEVTTRYLGVKLLGEKVGALSMGGIKCYSM